MGLPPDRRRTQETLCHGVEDERSRRSWVGTVSHRLPDVRAAERSALDRRPNITARFPASQPLILAAGRPSYEVRQDLPRRALGPFSVEGARFTDRYLDLRLPRAYPRPCCSGSRIRQEPPAPLEIEGCDDAGDNERHETRPCDWMVGAPDQEPDQSSSGAGEKPPVVTLPW